MHNFKFLHLFLFFVMLQVSGRAFRSKPLVDVDPKCLLYVQQREFAATTPADSEENLTISLT